MRREASFIFDLDGTLIDASERLYALFEKLVPKSGLDKEAYWRLKRGKIGHERILKDRLGFGETEWEAFDSRWLEEIERAESLAKDRLYPGVTQLLSAVGKAGFGIYAATCRQDQRAVVDELSRLGVLAAFQAVLVTGREGDKLRTILSADLGSRCAVFVGDTGKDVAVARGLGSMAVSVAHGFLSRENLSPYRPDIIFDDLFTLADWVAEDPVCRELIKGDR